VGLGPVIRSVELPGVVEDAGVGALDDPGDGMAGDRGPALVVDAAVAEHLEVLGGVPVGRVGVAAVAVGRGGYD